MVAYLTKSDASEGFNPVIDFLNGSYIKYALTVNPDIYVSCFKQCWKIVVIKQDNDVTRLQALVDKKKVMVTEAAIRESMSAKRTSWNEFSSAMASAVIFLSTGVKTHLFKGMLIEQEIKEEGDAKEHFEADIVAQADDTTAHEDDAQEPSIPSRTPPTPPVKQPQDLSSTSQALEIKKLKRRVKKLEKGNRVKVLKLQRLKKVGTSQRIDTSEDTVKDDAKVVEYDQVYGRQAESQVEIYKIDLDHASKVLSMQEDEPAKVQEVVDVLTTTKLITEVVTAASETVTAANTTISVVEPKVHAATITATPVRVVSASTRRRKGVVIRDTEEESTTSSVIPADTKSKDKGKRIMVEEPKPLKKKQQVEMDEEYARKLHAELNKNIDWDAAIDLTKEQMEEEENRAIQSINETPAQKAAKRRELNEEVEDLKRHLEIVPDEDDDVYTEAT
nr:hypothetical protein [Tanacetum cinerariifolium]